MITDRDKIRFLLESESEFIDFITDGALSALAKDEPRYQTNYIGSKQRLLDWIWAQVPDNVKSAADIFAGSSCVGYMLKQKGLAVISNDRLRYCYHIARAIVQNDSEKLTDDEIENLLKPNDKAGDIVQRIFKGIYFSRGTHVIIDSIRANIDFLSGYKKSIGLFALGKSCIVGKGGFGHFGTTRSHDDKQDSPEQFKERFKKNCQTISNLVFKGERPCKAYNQDILTLSPKVKADLAYYDPPYSTIFSQTNYEKTYHFIEGLMVNWEGLEINQDSVTKTYRTKHKGVTRTNANQFFSDFLTAAKHIPHWIISYRDQAFPTEKEIKNIISSCGKSSRMKSKEHQYQISAKRGDASLAKEHLFVCRPGEGATAAMAAKVAKTRMDAGIEATEAMVAVAEADYYPDIEKERVSPGESNMDAGAYLQPGAQTGVQDGEKKKNCQRIQSPESLATNHTKLDGTLAIDLLSLESEAAQVGDKKFKFILTHAGTNRNGDHFTIEELRQAAITATEKKIDLSHSQEFRDIVGAIINARFIEDGARSRIEGVGELYTGESESARLAYKLMKRKVVSHVSMECDYQEGECSICGKKVKSKGEYCTHLKNYKGKTFQGKPVFEILNGVKFTGMGLLDREGADAGAQIKQVANIQPADQIAANHAATAATKGENQMADDKSNHSNQNKTDNNDNGIDETGNPQEIIKKLKAENDRLKRENQSLQKRVEELESAQQAAERRAKAETLLKEWEKRGRNFGDEKARAKELERLAGLSDDYFNGTQDTVMSMPIMQAGGDSQDDKSNTGQAGQAGQYDQSSQVNQGDQPEYAGQVGQTIQKKPAPKKVEKSKSTPAPLPAPVPNSAEAAIRPKVAADGKVPSQDRLMEGFMVRYKASLPQ